jgi:hypothetical protein
MLERLMLLVVMLLDTTNLCVETLPVIPVLSRMLPEPPTASIVTLLLLPNAYSPISVPEALQPPTPALVIAGQFEMV